MATTVEKIRVEWEAKLDDFQREYAKLAKLPVEQANIAIKALDKQVAVERQAVQSKLAGIKEIQRAEAAAAKAAAKAKADEVAAAKAAAAEIQRAEAAAAKAAAKATTESTKELEEKWEAVTKIASAFGGSVGDVADVTEYLGKGFGGLAGTAGLAAAGVAAVGYAAFKGGEALVGLMNSATEARERLEAFEGVDPIPAESVARLEAWDEAASDMSATADRLRVELASALAPAMTATVHAIMGAIEVGKDIRDTIHSVVDVVTQADDVFIEWKTAMYGAMGPVGDFLDILDDGIGTIVSFTAKGGLLGAGFRALRDRGREAAEGIREVGDAAKGTTLELEVLRGIIALETKMEEDRLLSIGAMTEADKRENEMLRTLHATYEQRVADINKLLEAEQISKEVAKERLDDAGAWLRHMSKQVLLGKSLTGSTSDQAAATEALTKRQAAQAEAERILAEATRAVLTEQQQQELAYWSQIEALDALEQAGADRATVEAARTAVELASIQEVEAALKADAEKRTALLKQIRAIHDATSMAVIEGETKEQAAIREATAAYEAKRGELLALREEHAADAEVQAEINAELLELEEAYLEERDALREKAHQAERRRQREQAIAVVDGAMMTAGAVEDAASHVMGWLGDLEEQEQAALKRMRKAETNAERERAAEDLERVRRKKKTARQMAQIGQAAALVEWGADKIATVSKITLNTIEAVSAASPNPVLMAAAGALGAAQAAAAIAVPPPKFEAPKFHAGMAWSAGPDEFAATLVKGESVLNTRATQTVGPEVIDALNRGQPALQPARNYLVLDDNAIELIADRVTRSRAFESRLPRSSPRGR